MSSNTSSPTQSSTGSFNPPHVSQVVSNRLDGTNFLPWRAQILPFLQVYDLEKYVDGSYACPPQRLPNTDTINLAFAAWYRQDKIILSWIISSLTESVVSYVIGFSTSHGVWMALENQYASRSQAHLIQLQRELQTIWKGSLSMTDYLLHAKKLTNSLAAHLMAFEMRLEAQNSLLQQQPVANMAHRSAPSSNRTVQVSD
ncbi:hypothetical protein BVC80_8501g6 [Macleaya cordata]|uniref:Retrotransposon Copia-like N-terminal domain-containing protein n=1 Tax=Macleaya cordata TaxID=56857 RepID=A0A200QA22_MACCD|nr:hypothetical protein BVC80_8501g6 [Macleaya cordata]